MIKEIKTGNMIPEIKQITVCDNCGKTCKNNSLNVNQTCICWGNDNVDGDKTWDFCSINCFNTWRKFGKGYPLFFDTDYTDGDFFLSINNITLSQYKNLFGEKE